MYKTLNYCDIEDFCAFIDEEEVKTDKEYQYFGIVAKYEKARDIIGEFLFLGYKLGSIDLDFEYFDEYEITILEDSILCEPLKKDGEYIWSGATTVYTMEDVNSKCIKKSYPDAKNLLIVEFDTDEEEFDDDDVCVDIAKDDDGYVHGLTMTSCDGDRCLTHSLYSTEKLDTMEMIDYIRKFFW